MFQWVPYAFVRIAFFFIAGIVTAIYLPGLLTGFQAGIILTALVGLYFFFVRWEKVNPGPVGLLAIFTAGYLTLLLHTDARDEDHFIHISQPIIYYKAQLIAPAEEKSNSWKQVARVQAIKPKTGEWNFAKGNVVLYFSKTDFSVPFQYGDVLVIKGSPQQLEPPANPGEFNYKRFLSFRNIYHQHFVRKESTQLHQANGGNPVLKLAYALRQRALQVLATHLDGQQQQAIASALILGVKDGLDNELTQAYAASGAMHVLAVSGLHVGIIYGIMLFVLQPLTRSQKGKWLLALLSIFILWGYAIVTGFSPSVLRAVTMFSFVAIARPLNYRTNIYNILAASAFFLLVFDPYLIMSVGFQLSYLAVIGIVYLQPLVDRLWSPGSGFLDKVWQITCVSMAAQLATFVLGILYFHQFPVYFLVSNLFVIPGAFSVMIAGIMLLAVSYFTAIAGIIGWVLTWLIKVLNYLVFAVEKLPFSIVENIYISTFQCWLLILLVVSAVLLLQYRQFKFLVAASLCAVSFGAVQWHRYFNEIKPAKLVIYNVAGFSAIEISRNGLSHFFADPELIRNTERIRFHIRPNRMISGVYHTTVNDSSQLTTLIPGAAAHCWNKKLIVNLREASRPPENMIIDYLVISNNAIQSIDDLGNTRAKTIILDSSNSRQLADRLLAQAKSRSLTIHSVIHSGAFVN